MGSVPVRARDPLRNYQFTVSVQGFAGSRKEVAGVQRVSGLTCSVTASEVWEGGNNLHRYANPDKVNWDPLTLEQGIALDDTLETWAKSVRDFAMAGTVSPFSPVKRNVIVELRDLLDPTGGTAFVRRYRVYNAWIGKYVALPKLDALASEVALISVELLHEGWTVESARSTAKPLANL